jgi:hypothetical protein
MRAPCFILILTGSVTKIQLIFIAFGYITQDTINSLIDGKAFHHKPACVGIKLHYNFNYVSQHLLLTLRILCWLVLKDILIHPDPDLFFIIDLDHIIINSHHSMIR